MASETIISGVGKQNKSPSPYNYSEDFMSRFDLRVIIERAIDAYKETSRIRFFTKMVVVGGALIGATWVNIALRLSEKYFGIPASELDNIGTYLGIALVTVGVVAGSYELGQMPKRTQKRLALNLVSSLRAAHDKFSLPYEIRDSGYGGVEIMDCIESARAYSKVAPSAFVGNRVISVIEKGSIDGSKRCPFFGISLEEIDALIFQIKEYYNA